MSLYYEIKESFSLADGLQKTFSFSTCSAKEFACDNGECKQLEAICNGIIDCIDGSDEENCELITYSDNYLKHIPPHFENGTVSIGKAGVNLKDILFLSEENQRITLKFSIFIVWGDHRLTFHNLHSDKYVLLSKKEQKSIWLPDLYFKNSPDSRKGMNEFNNVFYKKKSKGELASLSNTKANVYFKGEHISLTAWKTCALDFVCRFKLHYYPFDTQTCSIIFGLSYEQRHYMKLDPDTLESILGEDYNEYVILDVDFNKSYCELASTLDCEHLIQVGIKMQRRLKNSICTIFLPTALIFMVCQCAAYFGDSLFKATISVNLTSMLCLITMIVG